MINRWFVHALLCFVSLLVLAGCSDDYMNASAPLTGHSLKILAIGNSFTIDGISYLPQMIEEADINCHEMSLYTATMSGASIDDWLEVYENQRTVRLQRELNGKKMKDKGSLRQLIAQPWDVIVIQQSSDKSNRWETYSNLLRYIDIIKDNCTNETVNVAFQQVWSRTPKDDPDAYVGNVTCSQRVGDIIGWRWIIPSGEAIQIARCSELNDDMYLTRDNHHLNYGLGQYIASCTWFESLVAPVFHKTILGSKVRPKGTYTNEEIRKAQECAISAVTYPFQIHSDRK